MEWIVRFVGIWAIFLLLANWKELKINIWCGVFAIGVHTLIDGLYIKHHYYSIPNPVINVMGSSLFFILGPVFVVAVLMAQFQPHKRWLQILYVVLISGVYDFEEFLLLHRGALIYENWSLWNSIVLNLLLMMCLSWFSITVLKRGVPNK